MKRHILLLCLLSVHFISFAQVRDMGGPRALKLNAVKPLDFIRMPSFDLAKDQLEDSINDALKIGPWRFGHRFTTDIGPDGYDEWHEYPSGDRVWRVGISSPGAVSLNLIFDSFRLPEGTFLYIYSPDASQILGAYTSDNNNMEDVLGTELISGDALIVEYYEPANTIGSLKLNIGYVTHGYRNVSTYAENLARDFGDSEDCNVDVNCPAGIGWTNQINAVAMIVVGGSGICSGALVNNTCNDGTPYFLTADHCLGGSSAPSTMTWAFRFNWQAPVGGTSCATTSPSANPGTYDETAYGASLVANNSNTDFALLQISNLTLLNAQNWNCYFAGWDHSDVAVTSGTGIHHPYGDIKKICHENNGLTQQIWGGAETWRIANWDEGVTEPGSSGSPLFDQNGRIVGQLYGGSAACSGTNDNGQPDFYGRFGVSWDAIIGSDNQLEPWLDACATGVITNDGWSPVTLPDDDLGVQFITNPDGKVCGDSVFTPTLIIKNFGGNTVLFADIIYSIDAGTNQTYTWTGSLAPGGTTTVNLPSQSAGGGSHIFMAQTFEPNGNTDNNTLNDDAQTNFDIVIDGDLTHLKLDLDCWGTEVTWEVQDQISGLPLITGGPYSDALPNGAAVKDSFCLESDCYNYVIYDSYGDGMSGAFCNVSGYYNLTNSAGDTLAEMLAAGAAYGNSETNLFCVNKVNGIEKRTDSDLIIYPNPSSGTVVMETDGLLIDATLQIYDIAGKLLVEKYISGNRIEMELDLKSGIYVIRIANANGYTTSKLIINKNQ